MIARLSCWVRHIVGQNKVHYFINNPKLKAPVVLKLSEELFLRRTWWVHNVLEWDREISWNKIERYPATWTVRGIWAECFQQLNYLDKKKKKKEQGWTRFRPRMAEVKGQRKRETVVVVCLPFNLSIIFPRSRFSSVLAKEGETTSNMFVKQEHS